MVSRYFIDRDQSQWSSFADRVIHGCIILVIIRNTRPLFLHDIKIARLDQSIQLMAGDDER